MAKIIYSSILPPSGYKCINLFGVLFVHKGCTMDEVDINHELIHTAQIKELWYVGFYILYVLLFLYQWVIKRGCSDWSAAYRANPFEAEAFANEEDLEYLDNRTKYAWTDYD